MTEPADGPVCYEPDGSLRRGAPLPLGLVPGSFNPLHRGHRGLAAAAAARLGGPVAFELSATNADKPELPAAEVRRRVAQFAGVAPVWVTRAWAFEAKAGLFPGVTFVVGYDTAARLVDPKYYAHDPARRDAGLRRLVACGCRVVVGGRVDAGGAFRVWDAGGAGDEFGGLFLPLTEADFRADVSSTQLREQQARPS